MSKIIPKHIPVLDGVRAYAVLLVCLAHFFQVEENALYETHYYLGIFLFKISQIGLKGVELFFLLSGFLITGILLDSKNSKKYFTSFYARRFLRIFPLYYFVLAVSFILLPRIINVDNAGEAVIDNQAWLWTYTSNLSQFFGFSGWDSSLNFPSFGHFWSLCVEEHFYIFWPFLIYKAGEKWMPKAMWLIVGISSFSVLFVYFSNDLIPMLKWSTIRCAGVLSLGGLIAWYHKSPLHWQKFSKVASNSIIPLGALFLFVSFLPRKNELFQILTFYTVVPFFASLIVLCLNDNKISNKLFNHQWLYFIGKISYGVYVYHGMLRPYLKTHLYEKLLVNLDNGIVASIIYTLLATVISAFISWMSWKLIESPILKLKTFFRY